MKARAPSPKVEEPSLINTNLGADVYGLHNKSLSTVHNQSLNTICHSNYEKRAKSGGRRRDPAPPANQFDKSKFARFVQFRSNFSASTKTIENNISASTKTIEHTM